MSLLAASVPVLVLIGLMVCHCLYFIRNGKRDSQQFIALADMSFRTSRGSACFEPDDKRKENRRVAGIYEVLSLESGAAGADPRLFDPILDRLSSSVGKTIVLDDDTSIAPGRYVDTVICAGDLLVQGDCVFLGPVKVGGDLIVTGNAAFLKPLTVAGHSRIQGLAVVVSGMIAKGEVSIEGTLRIGERAREAWLSADDVTVNGRVFLNGHVDSMGQGTRSPSVGPSAYGGAFGPMLLAILGYFTSNSVTAFAMLHMSAVRCTADFATLSCIYPSETGAPVISYAILAFALLVVVATTVRWLRASLAYPFILTISVLLASALTYDVVTRNPILEETRIVNDTMNVLGAAILASLVLTFLVIRRNDLPLRHVVFMIVASFAAKISAMVTFAIVRTSVAGATELLLLFLVYAFGAFALHLMVMCSALRHMSFGRSARVAPAPRKGAKPARRSSDQRAGTVDGLRGVAITMVVIYHYIPARFFSFSLGKPINSILFVVAGFFFAALLLKNRVALQMPFAHRVTTVRGMLLGRHLRIWPAMTLVVLFYLLLSAIDHGALTQQIRTTWPYYLTYLGYIPRWTYEAQAFPSHLWVISAQETLIAIFAIVLACTGLETARKGLWALVVLGIVSRLIGTALLMPIHTSMALETPLAVLDPIALGMIVRFGLDRTTMRSRLRRRLALALIATATLWIVLPNSDMSYFTLASLIAALAASLVMTLSADEVRGRRIAAAGLSSPWLVFLGRISFSLFLLHPLVNTVLRLTFTSATGIEMPWWLLFAVGPGLSIIAAILFARLVELPLRPLLRGCPGKPSFGSRKIRTTECMTRISYPASLSGG